MTGRKSSFRRLRQRPFRNDPHYQSVSSLHLDLSTICVLPLRLCFRHDIVPILPGRFVGFAHTEGEVHIVNSGAWISCPGKISSYCLPISGAQAILLISGQDNTNAECLIGYVPTLFNGNAGNHVGEYRFAMAP